LKFVTLQNEWLTVTLSTLGAEMQSIKDAGGVERLWQGDPQFWASRAPILFPIAGGLKEDCYYLEGNRYEMPKHGYVRKLEWQLESTTDTQAVFLMTEKAPGFPFEYELRACYTLDTNSIRVDYRVANRDKCAFCFGIGAHEGYATPGGIEGYNIVFDEAETLANHVLHGNLIAREPVVMGQNVKELALKYDYFAVDALVFTSVKSRGVTLTSHRDGAKIRVDYPQHDVLMLWTRPGAEYICIEPWTNAPDYVDSDMHIEHKAGCLRLEPGQEVERCHVITVL